MACHCPTPAWPNCAAPMRFAICRAFSTSTTPAPVSCGTSKTFMTWRTPTWPERPGTGCCMPKSSSTRRPTPRAAWASGTRSIARTPPPPTRPPGWGVAIETVIDGLHRACAEARTGLGISATLILCFLRHLSEKAAFETLEQGEPLLDKIVGVGLDSSEQGHPPEKFARVFARCRERGLHLVAHAGEEGPPAYIWSALDVLRVERIDHGVQAVHDAALMQRLAHQRIALTVCPLSNQKLCVFPSLAQHNLGPLLDGGLAATVNSDDTAYFGGYINENFTQVFAATGLTARHAYQLAFNSFEASFAGNADKRLWQHQLKESFERFVEHDY